MRTEVISKASTDQIEAVLVDGEATIARVRATQLRLLSELDRRQVPMADGSQSMAEWVAARMDLTPDHARTLSQTAVRLADQPGLSAELAEGSVSFDRATEESRLVNAGATPDQVAASRGFDLGGVRRIAARHGRLGRSAERQVHEGRFLSIQPTLDHTTYRMWGLFPGTDGQLVEQALAYRADQFPPLPDGKPQPRGQRMADALVAISQNTLDGNPEDTSGVRTPLVSIFVESSLAAETKGETGAETSTGIRVGPLTLEEVLCDGQVEILATGRNSAPLTVGPSAHTIQPKLRRFILHRDGGACTADGCQSRYRLQPHHIIPRSQGGSHDPDNLTTLCWFHHHVVIHRNGYQIDPDSPPQRRRFLKPAGRGPPRPTNTPRGYLQGDQFLVDTPCHDNPRSEGHPKPACPPHASGRPADTRNPPFDGLWNLKPC